MPCRELFRIYVVNGDLQRVNARGVEEPVAHHRSKRLGGHHRLGNEAVDRCKDARSIQHRTCHDFQRGIEGKMSDEYRKAAKQ